jgi:hypothetical protein
MIFAPKSSPGTRDLPPTGNLRIARETSSLLRYLDLYVRLVIERLVRTPGALIYSLRTGSRHSSLSASVCSFEC